MKNERLVSVLIPCFNHEQYVKECLDSIEQNLYKNLEYVIINDGSTDNSHDEILDWINFNPELKVNYINRENRGLSKTLNQLISLANGEYICIIASDDNLTKNSIKLRVDSLESNPAKYVAIGDTFVIDSYGAVLMQSCIEELWKGDKNRYLSDYGLMYSVVKEWSVPGPSMLARKSVYDIIGMYPEDLLCEDLNFYLQVFGRKLAVFVPENVAFYRIHLTNTSRKPELKKELLKSIVRSYLNNIKYYDLRLKLAIIKRILGNLKLYLFT